MCMCLCHGLLNIAGGISHFSVPEAGERSQSCEKCSRAIIPELIGDEVVTLFDLTSLRRRVTSLSTVLNVKLEGFTKNS